MIKAMVASVTAKASDKVYPGYACLSLTSQLHQPDQPLRPSWHNWFHNWGESPNCFPLPSNGKLLLEQLHVIFQMEHRQIIQTTVSEWPPNMEWGDIFQDMNVAVPSMITPLREINELLRMSVTGYWRLRHGFFPFVMIIPRYISWRLALLEDELGLDTFPGHL